MMPAALLKTSNADQILPMSTHPIPEAALDDRLAFVGTSGSGKTYNAGSAIERLLGAGARAVILDPLGVWWGLRSTPDGKRASPFNVVIFGGPHGDLPLTENAGALIGETAAAMAESCILDLSEIGTAAGERRFVAAFLKSLYTAMKARRVAGEAALLHLVLDEADMWAPQTIREKDGGSAQLFAITERIVRRGRIDGFIPWQITQRPAELSKSVLSQADGLVAMKFTAKQDRDALDGWIGNQADIEIGKRIKASLPTIQVGEGIVWIPGRGVLLERAKFPKKATFDSSRAPKRGEDRPDVKLKPLNLDALRDKLAKVEAEAKANDPRALQTEVARLKRELSASPKQTALTAAPASAAQIKAAEDGGYRRGFVEGAASREGEIAAAFELGRDRTLEAIGAAIEGVQARVKNLIAPKPKRVAAPAPIRQAPTIATPAPHRAKARASSAPPAKQDSALAPGHLRILEALLLWESVGIVAPTRDQVRGASDMASAGTFRAYVGTLISSGYVVAAGVGAISLSEAGRTTAPSPDTTLSVRDRVGSLLSPGEARILDAMPKDGAPISRQDLHALSQVESQGTFRAYLGRLIGLRFARATGSGVVAVEPWVWS